MSRTRRCAVALAILIGWLAAGCIFADESMSFRSSTTQVRLIELFTSEGCSSCPPAEKWLSQLKASPDLWTQVVPVAYHVDYWDHLGWRDRFAKKEFTDRQRRYASRWGIDSIYTPGFVLDGREWRDGPNARALQGSGGPVGVLEVTISGDGSASAKFSRATNGAANAYALEVAWLGTDLDSDVKRGENSGRQLRHDFVVLQLGSGEFVKNGENLTATIPASGGLGPDKPTAIAAWVVSKKDGQPIQATGGWLRQP